MKLSRMMFFIFEWSSLNFTGWLGESAMSSSLVSTLQESSGRGWAFSFLRTGPGVCSLVFDYCLPLCWLMNYLLLIFGTSTLNIRLCLLSFSSIMLLISVIFLISGPKIGGWSYPSKFCGSSLYSSYSPLEFLTGRAGINLFSKLL